MDENGLTQFFPSGEGVGFIDYDDSYEKESVVYLTPLFHDDSLNGCVNEDGPTGKCVEGTIIFH